MLVALSPFLLGGAALLIAGAMLPLPLRMRAALVAVVLASLLTASIPPSVTQLPSITVAALS